jgi:CheY-like chemotaxis protein
MSNPHALIIEDNPYNAEILASLLAAQGVDATIITEETGILDAVENAARIDVVFLDLEMPNQDGFEIFEALSAEAKLRSVPIVACTVHTSEINTARRLGFHSFLGKPLNAGRFREQLARILSNQPVWEIR